MLTVVFKESFARFIETDFREYCLSDGNSFSEAWLKLVLQRLRDNDYAGLMRFIDTVKVNFPEVFDFVEYENDGERDT